MISSNIIYFINSVLLDLLKYKQNTEVRFKVLVRQVLFTGFEALPVVLFTSMLLGASVISIGYMYLESFGQSDWTYNILISTLIRDFGPILVAFIILLRSGTAISTEMGSMSFNGEIKYIKSLGISPISYLVTPRIIGLIISIIMLMLYFSSFGIIGGYLVSSFINFIPLKVFLIKMSLNINMSDIFIMIAKVGVSAFVIGVICTFHGLRVESSITEIPQRNIKAVTQSIVLILIVNLMFIFCYVFLKE